MDDVLKSLRVRCRRTVLRKIESEEVTYDQKRKIFRYKDTEEEYKVELKGDNDSDDEDVKKEDKKKDNKQEENVAANSESEDDEEILKKIELEK